MPKEEDSGVILLSTPKSGILPLIRKKEKRKYRRYPLDSKLVVISKKLKGGNANGWCLNISKGGARIMVTQHLTIGEILEIKIERYQNWKKLLAKVVWVKQLKDGCIAGISFIE